MYLVLFAFAAAQTANLAGPTGSFLAADPAAAPICHHAKLEYAAGRDAPVRARPLTEEPAANLYLGVLRFDGRCETPVMIRENFGGSATKRR